MLGRVVYYGSWDGSQSHEEWIVVLIHCGVAEDTAASNTSLPETWINKRVYIQSEVVFRYTVAFLLVKWFQVMWTYCTTTTFGST